MRAKTLVALLLCLMVQDIEAKKNTDIKRTNSTGLKPKSFNGRTYKWNRTNHRPPPSPLNRTTPWLDVNPQGPATAFTRGAFSAWLIPSCYIVAMVVGVPSNAYIMAFLRVRASTFSTAVLYLSLACSDMLLLLSLPPRVHYHLNGNGWMFGETSCRLVTAVFYGNIYCSAGTIACISLKRYLAVVKPFLYRRLPKTSLAVGTCLGVWLLFGAAVVPELLTRQSYRVPQLGITTCHDVLPLEESSHALLVPYRLVLMCLGLLVPFVVCLCTHGAVVYHLGCSGHNWAPFLRVSTLVFLIFVVCFSPSGVLYVAHYSRLISTGDDRLYGYYRATVCLCCFHSCLDPFLCVLMSKTVASKLQFMPRRGTPQRPSVTT